ncbi:MAG: DUF1501 domain-containing protein [Planctomycetes bacterium]|nr:DUF1501 domain-containing protein [Planctomycetota bacterium]
MDRRTFLKTAAAAGGVLASARSVQAQPLSALGPLASARKTRHLVLVAFAGGVRTRETFGSPQNVPTLQALADDGVLYTRARTSNLGHFGAALAIFTGLAEQRGIRENTRSDDVTLFEYLRKDLGWGPNEAWIATSGGAQQVNYAYGTHSDYGSKYGANTLDGEGIFNREFKSLLDTWGRPRTWSEAEERQLAALRACLASRKGAAAAQAGAAQVERFLLQELTRGTADLTGPNASDAKALRVARNLLVLFRPRITAVVLQDADIAHGNYGGYVEVVRRNDEALGTLWQAVKQDPELADSTAIIVVPEFGRDRDLNSRRGLDHGDGSEDLAYVSCTCWGPDFKKKAIVKEDVGVVDVTPTICDLFGAKSRLARGKRLPGLYA